MELNTGLELQVSSRPGGTNGDDNVNSDEPDNYINLTLFVAFSRRVNAQ